MAGPAEASSQRIAPRWRWAPTPTLRGKLVIAANERPRARHDDEAFWRRVVEIPFGASIPAAERDPDVKAFLTDPTQAGAPILAWMAEGAAEWFAHRLGSAPEIDRATTSYRAEEDPLAGFFEDVCLLDPAGELPAGMLRQAYEEWCRDQGVRFPLSARKLPARLEAHGCRSRRGTGGTRFWQGIRLRTPSDTGDASDGDPRGLSPRDAATGSSGPQRH